MKLYEISEQFQALLNDADEFDEVTLADTLEGLTLEAQDKARNVAAYSLNLKADIEALRVAEEERRR